MKPTNLELATTFADCSLHFGGPVEASMFLLKTGENPKLPGFKIILIIKNLFVTSELSHEYVIDFSVPMKSRHHQRRTLRVKP